MTLTSEQISVFNKAKNLRGFDSVDFLRQCERYKDKPAAWLYTRVKNNARKFALRELNRSNGICDKKLKDHAFNESPRVCFMPTVYEETRYLSPEEHALICEEYGSVKNALLMIAPLRTRGARKTAEEKVTYKEFTGALSALFSERELKAIGELLK